jgi:hypothetical protein
LLFELLNEHWRDVAKPLTSEEFLQWPMLYRKELSLALKSIRDIPLLSRAYRLAVLFNATLSDARPMLCSMPFEPL